MHEPKLIDVFTAADDRGTFQNVPNIPFFPKRTYFIKNNQPNIIRAFHGHKEEWKYIYAPVGTWKVILAPMKPGTTEIDTEKQTSFILAANPAKALVVPAGWYNGFVNLTQDNLMVVWSSSTVDESRADDYRLDVNVLGENVWKIQHR